MATPYSGLNALLQALVSNVQTILNDNFIGLYLQGSFAVGDFDWHSDVDFTVVTAADLSVKQVDELQAMHGRLYDWESHWAHHLEGSYFPLAVLEDLSQRGSKLWYLDHGSRSLIRSQHCNTAVVRWVLRERGVSLAGPPAEMLIAPVGEEVLREEISAVMKEWGQEILDNPDQYNNRFYQGFIVLSYCRMLHSLQSGTVESKVAGAEWAKRYLDPSWSDLIDRTWDTRPNPARTVRQPADPEDFARTLKFIRTCIAESERFVA
jgi:hypothetical protein